MQRQSGRGTLPAGMPCSSAAPDATDATLPKAKVPDAMRPARGGRTHLVSEGGWCLDGFGPGTVWARDCTGAGGYAGRHHFAHCLVGDRGGEYVPVAVICGAGRQGTAIGIRASTWLSQTHTTPSSATATYPDLPTGVRVIRRDVSTQTSVGPSGSILQTELAGVSA
jgi:hypothetical protein